MFKGIEFFGVLLVIVAVIALVLVGSIIYPTALTNQENLALHPNIISSICLISYILVSPGLIMIGISKLVQLNADDTFKDTPRKTTNYGCFAGIIVFSTLILLSLTNFFAQPYELNLIVSLISSVFLAMCLWPFLRCKNYYKKEGMTDA